MQATEAPQPHTSDLDLARGLAALIVFAGHARAIYMHPWRGMVGLSTTTKTVSHALSEPTLPSHEAVIVFFVLSGYLVGGAIVRSMSQGRWQWGNYLTKRMVRLWIVLIPALILTACLDAAGSAISHMSSIYVTGKGPMMMANSDLATFLGNIVFLQTIVVTTFGINAPLWSLANEFWYYLVFPFLVIALLERKLVKRVVCALAAAAILWFVGRNIALYFLIWLIGVCVALVPQAIPARLSRAAKIAAFFAFLVIAVGMLKVHINLFFSDLIVGITFGVLCYTLLQPPKRSSAPFYAKGSQVLSQMSYTLYLTHVPILAFLSAAIVGSWHPWPVDGTHIAKLIGICVITFACSWSLYYFFERNTDRLRTLIVSSLAIVRSAPKS